MHDDSKQTTLPVARAIVDRVLAGVREFLGDTEAGDDITVMALRVMD